MSSEKEIIKIFKTIISTIDLILNNTFYKNSSVFNKVKRIIENWYEEFKLSNSLININVNDLKFIDLEISEFFSNYIDTEPIENNCCEILNFNFSRLKKFWKDELKKV